MATHRDDRILGGLQANVTFERRFGIVVLVRFVGFDTRHLG